MIYQEQISSANHDPWRDLRSLASGNSSTGALSLFDWKLERCNRIVCKRHSNAGQKSFKFL